MKLPFYILCLIFAVGCSNTDFSGSTADKKSSSNNAEQNGKDDDSDSDSDLDRDAKDRDGFGRDSDLFDDDDIDKGNDNGFDTGSNDDLLIDESEACRKYVDGYVGKVYDLPEDTPQLPDFSTITPVGEVESFELDVPPRDWTQGFPGVQNLDEWFAIQFQAELKVPKDGRYQFKTHSDDGSKLFVNGDLVVDNDGIHGPQTKESAAIDLDEGTVPLEIQWYQGPRTQIALQVFWKVPGQDWEIIPADRLRERKNCDLNDLGRFE